jgi:hypothetical protein
MIVSCHIRVFAIIVADIFLQMRLESVSSKDRLVILLEKRLSGVAEQGYTMSCGKSQLTATSLLRKELHSFSEIPIDVSHGLE